MHKTFTSAELIQLGTGTPVKVQDPDSGEVHRGTLFIQPKYKIEDHEKPFGITYFLPKENKEVMCFYYEAALYERDDAGTFNVVPRPKGYIAVYPAIVQEARDRIIASGYDIISINNTTIQFEFNAGTVTYYPFKKWATGRTIKDGRGLKNLLDQIKKRGS